MSRGASLTSLGFWDVLDTGPLLYSPNTGESSQPLLSCPVLSCVGRSGELLILRVESVLLLQKAEVLPDL